MCVFISLKGKSFSILLLSLGCTELSGRLNFSSLFYFIDLPIQIQSSNGLRNESRKLAQ